MPGDPNAQPEQTTANQNGPSSAGLASAREHVEPAKIVSGSVLGFLGVLRKRIVERLIRFQLVHQEKFNRGMVDAVAESEEHLRGHGDHLGVLSSGLEKIQADLRGHGDYLGSLSGGLEETQVDLRGHGDHLGALSGGVEEIQVDLRNHGDHLGALSSGLEEAQTDLHSHGDHLGALSSGLEEAQTDLRSHGDHLGSLSRGLEKIQSDLRSHGDHLGVASQGLEQLQDDHGDLCETVKAHGRHLDELATQVADFGEILETKTSDFEDRLTRETKRLSGLVEDLQHRFHPNLSFDHFDFTRCYRGDEEKIRQCMRNYAKVFGPVDRVLDIGCGRGEFLEACREIDIGAYGIDTDADMVSRCTMKALEVKRVDILEHLRSLEDRSLDGIFGAQVVEHLTNSEIVELIALAGQKMKRGATIILETINPDSFYALRWYFLDLTHRQPVAAETLKFLLEDTGFELKDVIYSSPPPEEEILVPMPKAPAAPGKKSTTLDESVAVYNRNVEKLNRLLYGMQDYAVIAER